jgi:hypothetical protein
LTPIQRLHFAWIDVEGRNNEFLLTKQQGKRQTDISHPNNANAGLTSFDPIPDFIRLIYTGQFH